MYSIIPNLNPEQQRAVHEGQRPVLIVAGAGTGKTKTLTSRIAYFIEKGMQPYRVCAITFTNKAAQEMAARLNISKYKKLAPYIGTFHSLGANILRHEAAAFHRTSDFTIFDDHDSFDLLKKIIKEIIPAPNGSRGKPKLKKNEVPAFFMQKISELKNRRLDETLGMDQEDELVQKIFSVYERALERNNAFDFDDLIQKPVALFNAHPGILKKYQQKFDAILVDEYQDINPKQYELVSFLATGHRNLTVVGDDEQTIYTWRHADIKIFLDFNKDWQGAAIHFLEENYRSTGTIVDAASRMVQHNVFRTPKKLWTREAMGNPITLYEAWGENEEGAWIAHAIQEIKKSAPASSMAVLYRTNAQSRAIEQALIRDAIPYRIYGGLKFYDRKEIKDAVAALRYASNQKDELSRKRLEKNLTKQKFANFKRVLTTLTHLQPLEVINCFLAAFHYLEYLEAEFTNADERRENIAELTAFASEFESLPLLLERLSLLQATDDRATQTFDAPTVHLSTIHLAKGLEFDAVFIAGAAEGILPHIRSIDNNTSLEEERRLMYVAMTRARKKLSISFSGIPSRFISEIPEEYIRCTPQETPIRADRHDGIDEIYDEDCS